MTASASRIDIPQQSWIDRLLPRPLRPYARLMRLDRPIGFWLLLIPGWWGHHAGRARRAQYDADDPVPGGRGADARRGLHHQRHRRPGHRRQGGAHPHAAYSRRRSQRARCDHLPRAAIAGRAYHPAAVQLGGHWRGRGLAGAGRHLSLHEAGDVLAAGVAGPDLQLGRAAGMGGGAWEYSTRRADPLCRRLLLDLGLRHDLRPSG